MSLLFKSQPNLTPGQIRCNPSPNVDNKDPTPKLVWFNMEGRGRGVDIHWHIICGRVLQQRNLERIVFGKGFNTAGSFLQS